MILASILAVAVPHIACADDTDEKSSSSIDSVSSALSESQAAIAKAKTPADPCAPKKNKEDWDLSAAFGLNATQGNVRSNLLTGTFTAQQEKNNDLWFFYATGAQGEQQNKTGADQVKRTTQEFGRGDAEYKNLLSDKAFLGIGTTALTDQVAKISYRAILNPLMGYFLVKDDDVKLSVEAGPSYLFQKQGGVKDNYLAPRVADRFDWKLSETSKLFQTAEVYFNTQDSEDTLINGEVGVEAALNSRLALVVSVKDRFDNVPAAGIKRNDVILASALKVAL
jgi:putative salt-induced outer membrane protein YdiY